MNKRKVIFLSFYALGMSCLCSCAWDEAAWSMYGYTNAAGAPCMSAYGYPCMCAPDAPCANACTPSNTYANGAPNAYAYGSPNPYTAPSNHMQSSANAQESAQQVWNRYQARMNELSAAQRTGNMNNAATGSNTNLTPVIMPAITPTYVMPTFSNPNKPYMDYLDRKMKLMDSGIGVPNYGG